MSQTKLMLAVIIPVLLLLVIYPIAYWSSGETVDIRITKLERVAQTTSEGSSAKYLVFTPGKTYEVTDTILFARFDSSDLYGSLEVGKRYRCRVVGWRVPFFSWYENILEAALLPEPLPVKTKEVPGEKS